MIIIRSLPVLAIFFHYTFYISRIIRDEHKLIYISGEFKADSGCITDIDEFKADSGCIADIAELFGLERGARSPTFVRKRHNGVSLELCFIRN